MVSTEEGSLTTEDGVKLYTKTWKPDGEAKARLVFIHGFSDHCNFYDDLFESLASNGIEVRSFDQRGWGRSVTKPSDRGATGPTTTVLSDITHFLSSLPPSPLPLFLMGHSMGGNEVATYISRGPPSTLSKIRGFLLESPMIALAPASRPWHVKVVAGRLAAKVLPKRQLISKLPPEMICRDEEVCKKWLEDELCHDTGTLEGLAGLFERASGLEDGVIQVRDGVGEGGKTRLWVGHGTGDGVCDYEACRRWFEGLKVEDKKFRSYEGWYHKLHCEPGEDKFTFANDVARWILVRSGSGAESAERAGTQHKL